MNIDKYNVSYKSLVLALGMLLVSGCSDQYSSNSSDIDQLISDSEQRAVNSANVVVEDLLPEIEGDDLTRYEGIKYTDPFTIPAKISDRFIEVDISDVSSINVITPLEVDPTRSEGYIKEPLESYDLEGLIMIGTIGAAADGLSALIDTGEGRIVTVYVGDYIGKNFGEVISISEGSIELSEKYAANTEKGWITRPAFINLTVKD